MNVGVIVGILVVVAVAGYIWYSHNKAKAAAAAATVKADVTKVVDTIKKDV